MITETHQLGTLAAGIIHTSLTWLDFMLSPEHVTGWMVTQPKLTEDKLFLAVFFSDKSQYVIPVERIIFTDDMEEQAVHQMVDSIRFVREQHQKTGPMHWGPNE